MKDKQNQEQWKIFSTFGKSKNVFDWGYRVPIDLYKQYAAKRHLAYSSDEDSFYLIKRTIPLDDTRTIIWFLKPKKWSQS